MTWHFDFHTPTGLAETLVQGYQARYFCTLFFDGLAARPEAISAADVAAYAAVDGSDESLHANFGPSGSGALSGQFRYRTKRHHRRGHDHSPDGRRGQIRRSLVRYPDHLP